MKRFWAVFGILLGMGVLAAGWSSINMSLASIQSELGADVAELQWMMNSYGIFICTALLALGKLGDSHGRKWVYMAGLFGLALACLGAGSAKEPSFIIASMGLFGLAAASILTLSQALTVHQFPEQQKTKAIAIWAVAVSTASSIGPLLGGMMIRYLSWRWIFFINIPLSLLSLLLVFLFVKKEETHSSHCDWSGVLLLATAVGGTVSGIMQGPSWGWSSWPVIGLFSLAAIALAGLMIVEKRSKEPLFQPKLFAHAGFLFASICNGCLIGFVWAIFFFVPLYLQNEQGASGLEAGAIMLFITIPIALLSIPVSKLYDRIGPRPLLLLGFSLLFLSVFFESFLPIQGFCTLIGLGWVLTWGPSASSALSSLPHHMAGIASGMFMTLQEIGGVIGLAIAGVFFRTGTKRFLAPHIDELQCLFAERTDALLSDPATAETIVGPDSHILTWLHEGFRAGYNDMLLFLSFFMILAFLCALLVPIKQK